MRIVFNLKIIDRYNLSRLLLAIKNKKFFNIYSTQILLQESNICKMNEQQ